MKQSNRELLMTLLWTPIILGAIAILAYIPLKYFSRLDSLLFFWAECAALVVGVYVFRAFRYPGIFQKLSVGGLALRIFTACLFFTIGLPFVAILSKFHIGSFQLYDRFGVWSRLSFRLKKGQQIQIAETAPIDNRPGEIGTIKDVRIALSDITGMSQTEAGTIMYVIDFPDGVNLVIPESSVT